MARRVVEIIVAALRGTGYAKRKMDVAKITERADSAVRTADENMDRAVRIGLDIRIARLRMEAEIRSHK